MHAWWHCSVNYLAKRKTLASTPTNAQQVEIPQHSTIYMCLHRVTTGLAKLPLVIITITIIRVTVVLLCLWAALVCVHHQFAIQ
jgi:hypothetical protein